MRKKIAISGGTGFIGKELVKALGHFYDIVIVTTNVEWAKSLFGDQVKIAGWNEESGELEKIVSDTHAIINLSGAPVAGKRWNKKQKKHILNSRLNTIQKWDALLNKTGVKPEIIVQASAIGYYGSHKEMLFDEQSNSYNNLFISEVIQKTEKAAETFQKYTKRLIFPRLSLVLGRTGGIFTKLVLPYKWGVGAQIGNGSQWMSWIHIQDVVEIFKLFLENENMKGVYNLSTPHPVTNKQFHQMLNSVLHKKSRWALPAFVVWLIFGEMGEEMLLSGQQVRPTRLLNEKYSFLYPEIQKAFTNILKNNEK